MPKKLHLLRPGVQSDRQPSEQESVRRIVAAQRDYDLRRLLRRTAAELARNTDALDRLGHHLGGSGT